jgi:methyl-accepting chemotaxis protein
MSESGRPDPNLESKPGTIRRRIIIIKRALQMKYVLLVFVAVFMTVTIVSLDLYYIMGKVYADQLGADNLREVFRGSIRLLAIHIPIYFAVVIVAAIFISHKFAGPIFRLEKVAEAMSKGDLTVRATLRDGDELFDTAEHINLMIELLRQKLQREKHLSDRIAVQLSEIAEKLENQTMSPALAVAQIKDILIEVRHIASDFKL